MAVLVESLRSYDIYSQALTASKWDMNNARNRFQDFEICKNKKILYFNKCLI
jgi:hypothetical protein